MSKFPVFPMWIGDYLADTSHLDATEHGVYHLLLYRYWLMDGRALTEDLTVLRRVAKCRKTATVERILTEFWELCAGEGWHHKRARSELRVTRDRSRVSRQNAKKRWENNDDVNATASFRQCSSSSSSSEDLKSRDLKTDLLSTAPKKTSAVNREDLPACPHQKIIDLYHDHTPCRRVRTWNGQRPGLLRTLWREHPELDWWRGLFQYVSESDFLCGRCKPNGDRTTFMADLEWMLRPNNFQKINEGKYHRDIRQTDTRGNGTTDAREATTRRLRAVPESGR